MSRTDGDFVAISLEQDRLVAVHAAASGGSSAKIQIKAWVSVPKPAEVDLADASAAGQWMLQQLRGAGMENAARRGRVIFGVSRGEVILKRIIFPPGTSEADLPGMVRLQMLRQLTVSPESAAIDFVLVPMSSGQATDLTKSGLSVLAGALQTDRIEWRRAVARAAGVRVSRMGLKATGAAALLRETTLRRSGGIMGITLGCGTTEFVVVEDGQLVFARSTELLRPDPATAEKSEEEAFAEKVAVEAKRTWMSYRVTADSAEIESVVVLGADECAGTVARKCQESLEFPADHGAFPSLVVAPESMPLRDRGAVAPLLGLIAEPALGRPTLDFANPRKAPDVGAAKRQRLLLGSLACILLLGGAYTYSRFDIQRRQEQLDQLTSQWGEQTGKYAEYVRLSAKLAHLNEWQQARVDWLAHLGLLTEELPDTKRAILDNISGRGDQRVTYVKASGQRSYSPTGWSHSVSAVFSLEGKVKRREVADQLRLRLVDDKRYKLDSKGADTPDRFDWRLTTTRSKPDEADGGKATDAPTSKRSDAPPRGTKKAATPPGVREDKPAADDRKGDAK